MESIAYSFVLITLFCISGHFFVKSLSRPMGWSQVTGYSKRAMKFEKSYRTLAWGISTLLLFHFTIHFVTQVFS